MSNFYTWLQSQIETFKAAGNALPGEQPAIRLSPAATEVVQATCLATHIPGAVTCQGPCINCCRIAASTIKSAVGITTRKVDTSQVIERSREEEISLNAELAVVTRTYVIADELTAYALRIEQP